VCGKTCSIVRALKLSYAIFVSVSNSNSNMGVTASIHTGEVSTISPIQSKSGLSNSPLCRMRRILPSKVDKCFNFHQVHEDKAIPLKEKLLDSFKLNKSFYVRNKSSKHIYQTSYKRNHAGIIINEFIDPGMVLNRRHCDDDDSCEIYQRHRSKKYLARVSPYPTSNVSSAGCSLISPNMETGEEIFAGSNNVDKFLTPPLLSPPIRTHKSKKYEVGQEQELMKSKLIEESRWKFKEAVNKLKINAYDRKQ
jgi:hypothetical protein